MINKFADKDIELLTREKEKIEEKSDQFYINLLKFQQSS